MVETLLKIFYKIAKRHRSLFNEKIIEVLIAYKEKTTTNPAILSILIKILTLAMTYQLEHNDSALIKVVPPIIREYAYMDQKEQVRIAASKSLG